MSAEAPAPPSLDQPLLRVGLDVSLAQAVGGQATLYARRLAHHLRDRLDVDLHTLIPPGWSRGPEPGARGRLVRAARLLATTAVWLPAQSRDLHPDVFHAAAWLGPLAGPGALVITVPDLAFAHYPQEVGLFWRWYVEPLLPRVLARATAIIVPSAGVAVDVPRLYGAALEDRVNIIPFGVEPEYPLGSGKRTPTPPDWDGGPLPGDDAALGRHGLARPYVVQVGDWTGWQRVPLAIAAFAHYVAQTGDPTLHLALIGAQDGGAAGAVRAALAASGQATRIHALGALAPDVRALVYRNAAAVLLPSAYEGFGLAALESMACGVPVIAAPAAVPVAEAARVVESTDPLAWAAALTTVLPEGGERAALIAAGREVAAAHTWERTAADTLDLYQAVAATRKVA